MSSSNAIMSAVRGLTPDRHLELLGLKRTGHPADPDAAGLYLIVLESGWSVVVDSTFQVLEPQPEAAGLAEAPEAVTGVQAHDAGYSAVHYKAWGDERWSVCCETEDGPVTSIGNFPAQIQRMISAQSKVRSGDEGPQPRPSVPLACFRECVGWTFEDAVPDGAEVYEVVALEGRNRVTPAEFDRFLDQSVSPHMDKAGFRRLRRLAYVRAHTADLTLTLRVIPGHRYPGVRSVVAALHVYSQMFLGWNGPDKLIPRRRGEPDDGGLVCLAYQGDPETLSPELRRSVAREYADWTVELQADLRAWVERFISALMEIGVPWLRQFRNLDDVRAWKEGGPPVVRDLHVIEILAAEGRRGEALERLERARAAVLALGMAPGVMPGYHLVRPEGIASLLPQLDALQKRLAAEPSKEGGVTRQ